MTATVRCFAHAGISHAFVANYSGQQSFHALTLYKEPYLARESLTVDTSTAVSSQPALGAANSRILRVQVQPGKRVHYEVTPAGHAARTADTSSPILEGNDQVEWGSGWSISVLEAS